jgi:hypothetical protein
MAKQFNDENRGVLFKSDNKQKPEDRDYGGEIDVRGEKFWLSGWIKQSRAGKKFLSLSIKPQNAQPAKPEFNDSVDF